MHAPRREPGTSKTIANYVCFRQVFDLIMPLFQVSGGVADMREFEIDLCRIERHLQEQSSAYLKKEIGSQVQGTMDKGHCC